MHKYLPTNMQKKSESSSTCRSTQQPVSQTGSHVPYSVATCCYCQSRYRVCIGAMEFTQKSPLIQLATLVLARVAHKSSNKSSDKSSNALRWLWHRVLWHRVHTPASLSAPGAARLYSAWYSAIFYPHLRVRVGPLPTL